MSENKKLDPARYDDKFYRIPKVIMTLYGMLPGFNSNAKLVYSALLDHAGNREDRRCWPTIYSLEFDLGISAKTISRALEVLKKYELITVQNKGAGKNYEYIVHEPLTVAEFAVKYPEVFRRFLARAEAIKCRRDVDLNRLDKSSD